MFCENCLFHFSIPGLELFILFTSCLFDTHLEQENMTNCNLSKIYIEVIFAYYRFSVSEVESGSQSIVSRPNLSQIENILTICSKYNYLPICCLYTKAIQFIENTIGNIIKYAYLGDLLSPL